MLLALPKITHKMKKIVTSIVALMVMGSVAFAQDAKKETKKTTKTETKKTETKK